ncbi:hypothetical protein FAGKG844_250035 [Frankia sp. AgKG'84/4]
MRLAAARPPSPNRAGAAPAPDRGRCSLRVVQDGRHVEMVIGGRVNNFIPNPTFDPVIVPGCLDLQFRGQIPEGVDPRSLTKVEPIRPEYRDRDRASSRCAPRRSRREPVGDARWATRCTTRCGRGSRRPACRSRSTSATAATTRWSARRGVAPPSSLRSARRTRWERFSSATGPSTTRWRV